LASCRDVTSLQPQIWQHDVVLSVGDSMMFSWFDAKEEQHFGTTLARF